MESVTTGASWRFIAPIAGVYKISGQILYASNTFTTSDNFPVSSFIYKNGSQYSRPFLTFAAMANYFHCHSINDTIELLAGEYIDIRTSHSESSSRSLSSGNGFNYINIEKIR